MARLEPLELASVQKRTESVYSVGLRVRPLRLHGASCTPWGGQAGPVENKSFLDRSLYSTVRSDRRHGLKL